MVVAALADCSPKLNIVVSIRASTTINAIFFFIFIPPIVSTNFTMKTIQK
jgi:hypothetical protein